MPCRLTGVPACRATAPSWATAAPEPRATASARRRSSNSAQPAARAGDRTSDTVPGRQPGWRPAPAPGRASSMACAVPSASEPMRITTVLPVRSDAGRVGEDVGATLEHEPDDAERRPASRHRPAGVLDASRSPSSRRRSASRQVRSPAIMSSRIRSDSTSRVVERPAASAARDVGVVGGPDRRHRVVVGEGSREGLEERRDLVVVTRGEGGERVDGGIDGARSPRRARPPARAARRRSPARRPAGHRRRNDAASSGHTRAITRSPPKTICWPDLEAVEQPGDDVTSHGGQRRWRRRDRSPAGTRSVA